MADTSKNFGESCHPVYHTSPLTLQELASMRVALCICSEKFRKSGPYENSYTFQSPYKRRDMLNSHKFTNKLPPKYIEMIDSCLEPIELEMQSWYESWQAILHLDNVTNCNRFDLVVLGGNGAIHIRDTIANFLEDDFLSDKMKFQISCELCMEDKVDVIWPLVRKKYNLDCMEFENGLLPYYWICRKRGELNRIHLKDFDRIEHLMIAKCIDSGDYFAVEYFLNLLDPRERLDQIDQMLHYSQGFECVKCLLPRLEAYIQHHVLEIRPMSICVEFMTNFRHVEFSVQTWIRVREFFTPELFYEEVIRTLIAFSRGNLSLKILYGVWSNTPFHLKEYTLKHLSFVLSLRHLHDCREGFGIMLAMISDTDVSLRNEYWEKNWPKWIQLVPTSQFNELLETCIVRPEAIMEFKKSLMSAEVFRGKCCELMYREYYDELDELLDNLNLEREQVCSFKKQILKSMQSRGFHLVGHLEKHSKYIDEVFSGNEALSRDFKESWFMSSENLKHFINHLTIFKDAKFMISLFVSSDRHAECKNKLLEYFRDRITGGYLLLFDYDEVKQFLVWCMEEDEQRVDDFLASLPIGDIFEAMFLEEIRPVNETDYRYCSGPLFDRGGSKVNQFFKSYFKSKPEFENFKREMIDYYERMDETEVRNKFDLEKRLVIKVMREGFLIADDDIID